MSRKPRPQITPEVVRKVRELGMLRKTHKEIGHRCGGISAAHVCRILSGKAWAGIK
jgi:hypothetical protein